MGLMNRLKRITLGRIEAFLDELETPEIILPQLLDELAETLQLATRGQAKALSAVRAAERKLDEATGRQIRMQQAAKQALQAGQQEIAKQALASQLAAEEDIQCFQQELTRTQHAYAEATAVRQQLTADLNELRRRKAELIGRHRVAKVQKALQEAIQPPNGESLLDQVARLEQQVEQDELAAGIASPAASSELLPELSDARLKQFLVDDEVLRRLEALKKSLSAETPS